MHLPDAHELISAWERGATQHWIDRALTLLALAYPEMTFAQLAALSIGQRDARLFALRDRLFGATINSFTICPQCDTRLDFTTHLGELIADSVSEAQRQCDEITSQHLHVKFRLPDSRDLAAAAKCADVSAAQKVLLERCVLEAVRDGTAVPVSDWSAGAMDALAAEIGKAESCADVTLIVACSACGHRWPLRFDIVAFLWAEIAWLAKRYLREVHTLAWAYGWREADILAMSPARRRFYIELVG